MKSGGNYFTECAEPYPHPTVSSRRQRLAWMEPVLIEMPGTGRFHVLKTLKAPEYVPALPTMPTNRPSRPKHRIGNRLHSPASRQPNSPARTEFRVQILPTSSPKPSLDCEADEAAVLGHVENHKAASQSLVCVEGCFHVHFCMSHGEY